MAPTVWPELFDKIFLWEQLFNREHFDTTLFSKGTDNHLFLVSLISRELTGKAADAALGMANITVNKNVCDIFG